MPFDYSDPPPPRAIDLIPDGTVATVHMRVRAGGVGEDEMLKRSKEGTSESLDCEFVVLEGPHAKRKFWHSFLLAGTTDGHAKMADSNKKLLKLILDSACNLDPDDKSPQARAQRTVSLKAFDGLNFVARIGIEKGEPKDKASGENWPDRNRLVGAITRNDKEWKGPVQQVPPLDSGGAPVAAAPEPSAAPASAPPITKPSWAS